jgi:carotenoid cleavage dioxygenase-like enzyme
MHDTDNPFLRGNYAPWREEGDAFDLEIEGELPKELNGVLYRIGPNPAFAPLGRYHWFDGDGMVHAIKLENGRASYRNRYVRTPGLLAEMKAGRALFGGLLEVPKNIQAEGPFKNAANTNIIGYANRLMALWEGGLPHELRPGTLETVGLYSFANKLNGPMTAHPKFDPETGELLFFGYQLLPPYVVYHRADKNGNLIESQPIETGIPTMMHDFVATRNHVIFFVMPSVFHLENIATGKPVLNWEPEHGTKIGVMNRKSGGLKWFHADAFYIFHFVNAFETNDLIVIDGCRMAALDMSGNSFGGHPPLPHRFTLKLSDGSVKTEQTDAQSSDFPRIDDRLAGLKHRFAYFAGQRNGSARELGFEVLVKRDYATGRCDSLDLGAHMTPGEPVFAPRKPVGAEDDGYVLAVWYNALTDRSEVTVIDPPNFAGKPVARIKLNHRLPFGFHGNWLPAAASARVAATSGIPAGTAGIQ